jgi:DNA-binding SARP family transcriptional activator
VRIGILGPLEVRDQAGQPVRLGGPRLRALLIRLALDPSRTIAAKRLTGDLWPDTGPADAIQPSFSARSRAPASMIGPREAFTR